MSELTTQSSAPSVCGDKPAPSIFTWVTLGVAPDWIVETSPRYFNPLFVMCTTSIAPFPDAAAVTSTSY